jgi:NADH dehydrogenase
MKISGNSDSLHRIVIVGGGAGGVELATRLGRKLGKKKKAEIVLVDANPTHIWKPLLHEVAAGALCSNEDELSYLAQAAWCHFDFQLGRMTSVDRANKEIHLQPVIGLEEQEVVPERILSYDTLVIAVGSRTNDFGTKGAAEHCIFLDSREQADRFHKKFLYRFLRAKTHPELDQSGLNIAIVGAGATGVELSAELHHSALTLRAYGLEKNDANDLQVTIIEAADRVMPVLPERVGIKLTEELKNLGVEVLTGERVTEVTEDGIHTASGKVIPGCLTVWAAGVKAPEFLSDIDGLETNRINQLMVRQTLQTTNDDDIFAIGDCASCPQVGSERPVPPRAAAANQQATFMLRCLRAKLKGNELPEFHYHEKGSLVSLSKFTAVGNLMLGFRKNVFIEGKMARLMYISLYHLHKMALYGKTRAFLMATRDSLGRRIRPHLKLH